MNRIATAIAAAALVTLPTMADAKGCIRGAAAGAVAGHYVGRGHAVAGAMVGCVAAHHYYARQARQQRVAAARPR